MRAELHAVAAFVLLAAAVAAGVGVAMFGSCWGAIGACAALCGAAALVLL